MYKGTGALKGLPYSGWLELGARQGAGYQKAKKRRQRSNDAGSLRPSYSPDATRGRCEAAGSLGSLRRPGWGTEEGRNVIVEVLLEA